MILKKLYIDTTHTQLHINMNPHRTTHRHDSQKTIHRHEQHTTIHIHDPNTTTHRDDPYTQLYFGNAL